MTDPTLKEIAEKALDKRFLDLLALWWHPITAPAERSKPYCGEIRVINGQRMRFIEREPEGDKWEPLGPDQPHQDDGDPA